MGIDISAKLIYGLPYEDIPEEILGEVNDMLDSGELDYASPYYDVPRDRWIVGVEYCADGLDYIDLSWSDFLDNERIRILGSWLKFYVTPHVY